MWVEDIKQCAALYGRWHYYLSWWSAACFLQLVSKALHAFHLVYCLSKEFECDCRWKALGEISIIFLIK